MLLKILKTDYARQKIVTLVLFIFIMLSALLAGSGVNMIFKLFNSLNYLFVVSEAPHVVQMHAGEIDLPALESWAGPNSLVRRFQAVEMINLDGADLYIKDRQISEAGSIMDASFVRQNRSFDFLLDLDNRLIRVSPGEVAVPIHYLREKDLQVGDRLWIARPGFEMELTVTDFVRDAQMNPAVVTSKRFVVHETDFETLQQNLGELEYLIEFQLHDTGKISEFSTAYASTNLPKTGPLVDIKLVKTLNVLTDGMVAGVIILVSLLINLVALLCLSFTIHAAVEEDYREIGVMKAIGIQSADIRKIYLAKYAAAAALACLAGGAASLPLNRVFTANILLYMGAAPKSLLHQTIPFLAVTFIFVVVVSFCAWVLRSFNRISAVEALRSGSMGESRVRHSLFPLHRSGLLNVNLYLGLRDVAQRFKMYRLLFFVFFVCTFIMIVPVNLLNTIQSPAFITYMGAGRSDIRIDLRHSEDVVERYAAMLEFLENDPQVERFSALITSQYQALDPDGAPVNLNIETGDFSVFPLEYLEGAAPTRENEIALSYLNYQELSRQVGESLTLLIDGREQQMLVSGVYQDVTNGGRTAKAAALPFNPDRVLWYVVSIDVRGDVRQIIDQYSHQPGRHDHPAGHSRRESGCKNGAGLVHVGWQPGG